MIILNNNWGIYLLISVAFIAFSLVIYANKNKQVTYDNFMNINHTCSLKGLSAFIIFIHHFVIRMEYPQLAKLFLIAGVPAVAIFLFISGYALSEQLQIKGKSYLMNFSTKKIARLYIPWLISILIFVVFFQIYDIRRIIDGLLFF
jgi:membrane-bound acyltransferase YfiQ involved in biofilm formation